MAGPTYETDLTDIALAENATDYSALNYSGGGGGAPAAGPDIAMHGTNCVDRPVSSAERAIIFDDGAGLTAAVAAGVHIFQWMFTATPGITDTLATRGVYVVAGSASSATIQFHVDGSDTFGASGRVGKCYPYKYDNTASAVIPYRTLNGSPGATPQFFGAGLKTIANARGSNLGCDAVRYGTGGFLTIGEAADPATFSGFALENDRNDASPNDNRWGILSKIGTSLELQGRFVIGKTAAGTATACYFEDSNISILIVDTPHCEADFTKIIVDHASSTFDITNVNIEALGTINKGEVLIEAADPTVNITGGTWKDIGPTTLRSNSTVEGLVWRGCDPVASNAASISNATFDKCRTTEKAELDLSATIAHGGESDLDIGSEDTSVGAWKWNDDGTKLFASGTVSGIIFEYTLSIAYDIGSTFTYTNNSFNPTEMAGIEGFCFNTDGTKLYILSGSVYEYTLSTGFDLSSTVTYTTNSFSVTPQDANPFSIRFSADGTKFFVIGTTTPTVYEYSVSVAFDLGSTVAYSGNSLLTTGEETSAVDLEFSRDGTRMIVLAHLTDMITEYTLSVGFDLSSTVTYAGNQYDAGIHFGTNSARTVIANDLFTKLYFGDNTFDTLGMSTVNRVAVQAVTVANLSELSNPTFTQDERQAGHAIKLTGLGSGTMAWNGSLTGFAPIDGSRGNEAIYVAVGTGTLTINVAAGASTPSIMTDGATVTVSVAQIAFDFTVNPSITGYEWRLYEKNVTEGTIGTVELDGEESASTDNQTYLYSYTSDTDAILQIIADGYEESLTEFTLKSTDLPLTINLTTENNT